MNLVKGKCMSNGLINVAPIRSSIQLCLLMAIMLVLASQAFAQTTQPADITNSERKSEQPLDEFKLTLINSSVGQWIKRGSVSDAVLPVYTDDVSAVMVVIRLDGMRLGTGKAYAPNPLLPWRGHEDGKAVNIMKLTKDATAQALEQAKIKYEAHRLQVKMLNERNKNADTGNFEPIDPDQKPAHDDLTGIEIKNIPFGQAATEFTFELQLASQPRKLIITELDQIAEANRLGLEGLAMQNQGKWGWIFPGEVVTQNLNHNRALIALIGQLNLSPNDRGLIGTRMGPAVFEFDVTEVVRHHHALEPEKVMRGQKILPATPLKVSEIDELMIRQARSMIYWMRNDGSFHASFNAPANRASAQSASLESSALALYALARLESRVAHPKLRQQLAEKNLLAANRILMNMGIVPDPNRPPNTNAPNANDAEMAPNALTLLALLEAPSLAGLQEPREELIKRLLMMQNPDGWYRPVMLFNARLGQKNIATFAQQSLATYTLARLFVSSRQPEHRQACDNALKALWSQLDENRYISTLPWLPMAEFQLEASGIKTQGAQVYLKKYAPAIWKLQVTPRLAEIGYFTNDAIGGLIVRNVSEREPTWQTTRLLISQAMVYPFITENKEDWRIRLLLGARYLKQLTLHDKDVYFIRDKRMALGSMRRATFDSKLTLEATAMGLLSLLSIQENVGVVKKMNDKLKTDASTKNNPPVYMQDIGAAGASGAFGHPGQDDPNIGFVKD